MDVLYFIWALILCYDVYLLYYAKCAVDFVEEWTSLKQAWIERLLMMLCFAAGISTCVVVYARYPVFSRWLAFFAVLVAFNQWQTHRRPSAIRINHLFCQLCVSGRVSWQLASLLWILPPHHWNSDLHFFFWYVSISIFDYVSAVPSDGQPGRRRRLALSKLKELFGTSWIPQPHGAQ